MGLYISAGIVERDGGKIGVNNEAGRASTFWFTLPLGDN
jgi:signal transduction histidine kinase